MNTEKPNEPTVNPTFRDGFDETKFNALRSESAQAFIGHAGERIQEARNDYDNAELAGDSRQADEAAGALSRLAMGVAFAQEQVANPDRLTIPVNDLSGPAEHLEVQRVPEDIAA